MKDVVPATKELLRAFYGDDKLPTLPTMRAFCLLEGETPVAVAGFVRVAHNVMALFSDAAEGARKRHPVGALKLGRMLTGIADEKGWTLISDADPSIPEAEAFLKRLGFEPDGYEGWIR